MTHSHGIVYMYNVAGHQKNLSIASWWPERISANPPNRDIIRLVGTLLYNLSILSILKNKCEESVIPGMIMGIKSSLALAGENAIQFGINIISPFK